MFFPVRGSAYSIGGATKVVGSLAAAMKVCLRAAIGGTTTVWK
jgi:hypothetical protein